MADGTKKGRRKRPKKQDCINFIDSQFSLLQKGIPGYTREVAEAAIVDGEYFLYKAEVEKLVEERLTKNPDYNAQGYVQLLQAADALQEGAAPRFGESQAVRINSIERALEVANDPNDAEKIAEIVSRMVELRKVLDPLISVKASCSIALKNKKKVADETGEKLSEGDSSTPNEETTSEQPAS